MRRFGLIGYPLSHSFSPGYFARKFVNEGITDARYDLYPLKEIYDLEALLDGAIHGLNVTIPYKQKVQEFLDWIHPDAEVMGAVNTIKITGSRIEGYNTDVYGFERSLLGFIGAHKVSKALILGTGGSSKAVCFVLGKMNIDHLSVSRSRGDLKYDDINARILSDHQLIINTTPLGMHPNIDQHPELPYHLLSSEHYLFDLIYNPAKTLFLQHGADVGAKIKNGLEMLELQADRSWEIWNDL